MSRENQRIPVMVGRPQPQIRTSETRPEPAAEGMAEAQNFQTPLIDIHEGPDGLVLEADLPGATEEGVVIQLEENVLTLHAHVPSPAPEGARALHEEYRVADFHRSALNDVATNDEDETIPVFRHDRGLGQREAEDAVLQLGRDPGPLDLVAQDERAVEVGDVVLLVEDP